MCLHRAHLVSLPTPFFSGRWQTFSPGRLLSLPIRTRQREREEGKGGKRNEARTVVIFALFGTE